MMFFLFCALAGHDYTSEVLSHYINWSTLEGYEGYEASLEAADELRDRIWPNWAD